MAISHADHNHPNTPAARAACRKRMNAGQSPRDESAERALAFGKCICNDYPGEGSVRIHSPNCPQKAVAVAEMAREVAQMTVVPRKRGDGGVVKGMQATKPQAAARRLKVSGVKLTRIGDLADVPAVLATEVRRAWKLDWMVQAGHPFNDDERRIVITGPKAEIALVWDSNGRTGTFVRHHNSSVTRRLDTPDEAFDAADTDDAWDGHGNFVGL
jgi:hypothetical protein